MTAFRYIVLLSVFVAGLSVSAQNRDLNGERTKRLMELPPFERAVLVIKRYETLHSPSDWPYVGYGHRVQKGEPYKIGTRLTEREADWLLRRDLEKRCATFRRFGRDSLLLATLAYQVGESRLLGGGKRHKSRLIRKLEAGDRNIYKEYVSFRKWKGKMVPSIERRRKVELLLLYAP